MWKVDIVYTTTPEQFEKFRKSMPANVDIAERLLSIFGSVEKIQFKVGVLGVGCSVEHIDYLTIDENGEEDIKRVLCVLTPSENAYFNEAGNTFEDIPEQEPEPEMTLSELIDLFGEICKPTTSILVGGTYIRDSHHMMSVLKQYILDAKKDAENEIKRYEQLKKKYIILKDFK